MSRSVIGELTPVRVKIVVQKLNICLLRLVIPFELLYFMGTVQVLFNVGCWNPPAASAS